MTKLPPAGAAGEAAEQASEWAEVHCTAPSEWATPGLVTLSNTLTNTVRCLQRWKHAQLPLGPRAAGDAAKLEWHGKAQIPLQGMPTAPVSACTLFLIFWFQAVLALLI